MNPRWTPIDTQIKADLEAGPATHPHLVALHRYWRTLSAPQGLPHRDDFRPAAIKPLLPHVFLVDVLQEPLDFKFRLLGSAITMGTGRDITGLSLKEAFQPDFGDSVFLHWSEAVRERRPSWAGGRMWLKEKDFLRWQGVVLPLAGSTPDVSLLLGSCILSPAQEPAQGL